MRYGIKKFLAAILALVLCAGLAGCSDTKTGGADASEVTVVEAEYTAAPARSLTDVTFSHGSGFYASDITLEMNCATDGVKIFYTLDGSVPDDTDILYTGAINLSNKSDSPNTISAQQGISAGSDYTPKGKVKKANVIRAVAYLPDGTRGEVRNGTFWVGIDRNEEYGNVPVISLMTEIDNLYDYETGIYTLGKTYDEWKAEQEGPYEAWQAQGNYSNKGKEWERPVNMEYIEADGGSFMQDLGFRIMGAASRNDTQKSLRLVAREDYGLKAVEYPLIPGTQRSDGTGEVTKYKSFVLRNGGNDASFAKIRDPYIQKLADGGRYDTMASMPCIVYLNGEYWGMYTMAEDYSDNYIENNYGIDNKNVIAVKQGEIEEGNDSDIELYNEMFDFVTTNDMADEANYAKACEMIDMGSLVDYLALNLYIYNEDGIFEGHNWQMWRVRDKGEDSPYADGKWRMLVYDNDYSSGIYNDGNNYTVDNISKALQKAAETEPITVDEETGEEMRNVAAMINSLYQNPTFKEDLVTAMCNMRNVYFEQEKAMALMKEMGDVYKKLVPPTFDRFGPDWLTWDTQKYYYDELYQFETFMDKRYLVFCGLMQDAMDLSKFVNVTISSSDASKGTVSIDSTVLDLSKEFTGRYFPDYTLTVTAEPADGASFKCWECTGAEISDPASPVADIKFTGDFTLKAVFE
ncbi:MAG: CotH kinase family protein [Oscillospiraceae bacterium]|nr:CotH kinase family protein [Oscillospiraceae bacterium]